MFVLSDHAVGAGQRAVRPEPRRAAERAGPRGEVVNALSTFGMMLVLTYRLQSVMAYTALQTGLVLIPFALTAAAGSAFAAPALMRRLPPASAAWPAAGPTATGNSTAAPSASLAKVTSAGEKPRSASLIHRNEDPR